MHAVIISLKRLLRQPGFVLVCAVLLVAAVSLNASVEFMQLHFQKQAVDMRQDFSKLPSKLGPWVQISKDEPLPVDQLHSLGTEQYLYRYYVDSRQVKPSRLAEFEGKDYRQRQELIWLLQKESPGAVISIGLTYYTGMVDTVSHIPDRCYIADGFVPTSYKIVHWSAFDQRDGRSASGDARLINFEDQSAVRTPVPRTVCYFFHCNGQYESDPIGVRKRLGNLFERFGYYSKVELMMQLHDDEAASKAMNDLLQYALPEVEKCLPDWQAVAARKT
jgi:hypothetical protein